MNIVATGGEEALEQILKQLNKLIDVVYAKDSTVDDSIQRELALIKVSCPPDREPRCSRSPTPSGERLSI
jgi:acetolactate synthase small subunit